MTNLPGNPYISPVDDAVIFSADGSPMQTTEFLLDNLAKATQALAYEQRTANLIAFYAAKEINTHITGRLGLNEWTQS